MHMPDPTFPPLLTGHGVKSPTGHFEHAVSGAASGTFGAGDCIWSRNTQRFDCAIVLEPDVPLSRAKEMLHVAMVAFGDAFGVLAPPEVGLMYRWPGMLRINSGRIGEVRLAVSPGQDRNGCPDWMVLDIGVQMAGDTDNLSPGDNLGETNFYEEGCVDITRTELIESYSRHFLTWLHTWKEEGFAPIHQAWTERAEDRNREMPLVYNNETLTGTFLGLDDTGNLLLKVGDNIRLLTVETALGLGAEDGA